jgi:hypothetical protein
VGRDDRRIIAGPDGEDSVRKTILVGAVLMALALAGCQTKYGGMGFDGGVEVQPISTDMFRVVARGNEFTDRTTIENYTYLKAAETTLAMGGRFFIFVSGEDVGQTEMHGGDTYVTYHHGRPIYHRNEPYTTYKPGMNTMVQLVDGPGPAVFDAAEIVATLGPQIERANN